MRLEERPERQSMDDGKLGPTNVTDREAFPANDTLFKQFRMQARIIKLGKTWEIGIQ